MEDSIIKIKLVLEDKSEKQTDISVSSNCLNINDDFVEQLFGMKFTDNKIINCNIVLAANNLAVNIENYSLTEVINISGFFNSPSKVSTFKSRGTNVHIVNQEINILQLDCQKILLAESCLNGCIYCYAIKGNYNSVEYNTKKHDRNSPLLIGHPAEDDVVKEREMKSLRSNQYSLF